MSEQSVTRFKVDKNFYILGYVLDEETFERIDNLARLAVNTDSEDEIKYSFGIITSDNNDLSFESKDSLFSYINSNQIRFHALGFSYRNSFKRAIALDFNPKGKITLYAQGDSADFQFNVNDIIREIKKCDQEYNWAERKFVFDDFVSFWSAAGLVIFSIILLFFIGSYIYVLNSGIKINNELILRGDTYYAALEQAIKSENTNEKLNILLRSELKNFTTIEDVLVILKPAIAISSICIVISLIAYLLNKKFTSLYPLSFLALGSQKKELQKLQKKRDFWGTVVAVGFAINLLSGIVIAVVTLLAF